MDGQRTPTDSPASHHLTRLCQWPHNHDGTASAMLADPQHYDGLELVLPDIHLSAIEISQANAARSCADLPVLGWYINAPISAELVHHDADIRCRAGRAFCSLLERAADSPVERISLAPATTIVPSTKPAPTPFADSPEMLERTALTCERLVIPVEQAGVVLCLPAGSPNWLRTPTDGRLLADWVNHPAIGVDLDCRSSRLLNAISPATWIKSLDALVRSVAVEAGEPGCEFPEISRIIRENVRPSASVEPGVDRPMHVVARHPSPQQRDQKS